MSAETLWFVGFFTAGVVAGMLLLTFIQWCCERHDPWR